jgi:hypothetical protein
MTEKAGSIRKPRQENVTPKKPKGKGPATRPQPSGSPGIVQKITGWIGVVSLVLGAITSAAEKVQGLKKVIYELFGQNFLFNVHIGMSLILCTLLIAAYLALCTWFYLKYLSNSATKTPRIAVLSLAAIGALLTSVTIYLAIPAPPNISEIVRNETIEFDKELLSLHEKNGGMRYNRSDTSVEAQVWCTAQALWAILSNVTNESSTKRLSSIAEHLDYIDRVRLPGDEGWGYMESHDWGVTEIIAWVTLANVAAVHPNVIDGIWAKRPDVALARIENYLQLLQNRQMENGAWAPVRQKDNRSFARTYSTLMSVWAMVEAQKSPALRDRLKGKYDASIRAGMTWILTNYNKELASIVPNPERAKQIDAFPGLTAQVLYVMERARPEHGFALQNEPNYGLMRKSFINSLETSTAKKGGTALLLRDVSSNDRIHDSDRYLPRSTRTVESSTFLWLPWTLAFCSTIKDYKDDASDDLGRVTNGCNKLGARANDLIRFAKEDPFVYVMAECLFALRLQLPSRIAQQPKA